MWFSFANVFPCLVSLFHQFCDLRILGYIVERVKNLMKNNSNIARCKPTFPLWQAIPSCTIYLNASCAPL